MSETAMDVVQCPCGKGLFAECCGPVISGTRKAQNPEELMRARYSAYATGSIAFLRDSLAPDQRHDFDEKGVEAWSQKSEWLGIDIRAVKDGGPEDNTGFVEFVARYKTDGVARDHRELSEFRRNDGQWFFYDGKAVAQPTVRNEHHVGRNDPCPCGSGKKYKKCCGA